METVYCKLMLLDGAMVVRPVTAEDIKWANDELEHVNLPAIPSGYVDFLRHCNGFAFNGVELFGTDVVTDPETDFQLIDIISFSEENWEHYNERLLYFGRVDDDIYTYNPAIEKYEIRDITSFEVWDQYDNFGEFLEKEISDKYLPPAECEDLSTMVRSRMKVDPVFAKNVVEYYTLMAERGNEEALYQLELLRLDECDDEKEAYDDDGRYDAWV